MKDGIYKAKGGERYRKYENGKVFLPHVNINDAKEETCVGCLGPESLAEYYTYHSPLTEETYTHDGKVYTLLKEISLKSVHAENPCEGEWNHFFHEYATRAYAWDDPIPINDLIKSALRLGRYDAWLPWLEKNGFIKVEEAEPELKPCPFCGGEAHVTCTSHNGDHFFPRCTSPVDNKCPGNQGWVNFKTKQEAIEAWNRRA